MYRIIECLTQEHDYWLLAVAGLVCVAGSCLTVMTLRRVIMANGTRKIVQLGLSGMITGATIWATHFIAMLAYDPGVAHGYAAELTGISLALAVFGSLFTNSAVAYYRGRRRYLVAGTGFGITVSLMHYVGMSAYQLPGEILWHAGPMAASVLLGVTIGIFSYHRIVFPVTRYCWMGGAILMGLSIITMHFTGMSAFEIRLSNAYEVPPQLISDNLLGILIFSVVTLILFVGFSAISIETKLEKEAIDHLRHTVAHDQLTGLPNRRHLREKLAELIVYLQDRPRKHIAIISVDLDSFQQINDINGHDVGDRVLVTIASRLKTLPNKGLVVARVGGDEFVVIDMNATDTDNAKALAQDIRSLINQPIHLDKIVVATSASLGIATSIYDGRDPDELLRKSNLAMSRNKQDIDNGICEYTPEMDQLARDRLLLINDLRLALANEQFELVYQLQNDAHTREAVGCEVLLRWLHPTRGMVSPVVFIPLAEETGLIQEIGQWVLRTACIEAASWTHPLSIAVNVAPQQLAQPTFVEVVADILMESGLPVERLELEVTEASVIHDPAFALKVLQTIKKMGVRIAMDDFGTGYSSLATLQTFPFDKIKIDRSFVTDLHQNAHRAAIVRATLSLGEAFGISVLAEGVETEDELMFLSAEGCNLVQGFYFGKPKSLEAIRALTVQQDTRIAS